MSALSAVLLTYFCKLKVKRSYKKGTLPLHFIITQLALLERYLSSLFVLVFFSFGVRRNFLEGYFLASGAFIHWKVYN
jgi:hypothetical protein